MHENRGLTFLLVLLAFFLAAVPLGALEYPESVPGELYQQFIEKDLEHASHAELLIWARSLGLPDSGDRTALIALIKEHYRKIIQARKESGKANVVPPSASPRPGISSPAPGASATPMPQSTPGPSSPPKTTPAILPSVSPESLLTSPGVPVTGPAGPAVSGSGPGPATSSAPQESDYEISIVSAAGGKYFTIEAVNEKIFRLLGGVQLLVTEKKNGNKHSIKAEEILFDQESSQMVARINVVYSLTQGGDNQIFQGQEMLFTPSSGDAVFLEGKGDKSQTLSGSGVQVFHINSGLIIRTLRDILLFYHANLSSSVWSPYAWMIGASRIWVLSPGEWAINDLVLYLGTVPVFYLPFFYLPPDELIFHPAVGSRTVEGSFVQTTWYLIGKKKQADQGLSFLQLDSGMGNDYSLEPHGLFLKKVSRKAGAGASPAADQKADDLKASLMTLIFDYYSRLGYLGGLNLEFAGSVISQARLKLKLAATKWIFSGTSSNYTDYYLDPSTKETLQVWDRSHLFGSDIPFRYALDFSTDLKFGDWRSSIVLSLPSDPYILSLYSTRAEDIDWTSLLGMGKDSTTTTAALLGTPAAVTPVNINNNFSTSIPFLDPVVKSLTINKLSMSWPWSLGSWTSTPDSTDADDVPASVILNSAKVSSEKQFYYPSILTLPDASVTLSGTVFEYPVPVKSRPAASPPPPASGARSPSPSPRPRLLFPGDEENTASPSPGPSASPGPNPGTSPVTSSLPSPPGPMNPAGSAPGQPAPGSSPGPDPAPDRPKASPGPSTSPGPKESAAPEAVSETNEKGLVFNSQPVELTAESLTGQPFRFNLAYTITPSGNLQAKFAEPGSGTIINDPYDINPVPQYWTGTGGLNSGLTWSLGGIYDMITASGGLTMAMAGKEIFGEAETTSDSLLDAARLLAARSETINVTQTNTVSLFPFKFIPFLTGTSIQYGLSELLYQKKYQSTAADGSYVYTETPFDWTSDLVTSHSLGATLAMKEDWFGFTAGFNYTLPPKTELLTYNSSLTLDFLTLGYTGSVNKVLETWTWDTMSFSANAQLLPDLALTSNLSYSPQKDEITGLRNTFRWGSFSAYANLAKDQREQYKPGLGWSTVEDEVFQLTEIGSSMNLKATPPDLWEGRIRQDLSLSFNFRQSLIRATQSLLSYDLTYAFKLNEFLDLGFSLKGENNKVYRYFDALAGTVGASTVSILDDLGNSFNIFDEQALKNAFFKLKSLSLKVSHDLGDWTLSLDLSAAPKLTTANGTTSSTWDSTLTLLLQWKPIKEIKQKMQYKSLTDVWTQIKD